MPAAGAPLLWFFADCFFDWQTEWVNQRYTEEGLLVACVVIFSQLRLPNCLRTVLLLLLGVVLQQLTAAYLSRLIIQMNSTSEFNINSLFLHWRKDILSASRQAVGIWLRPCISGCMIVWPLVMHMGLNLCMPLHYKIALCCFLAWWEVRYILTFYWSGELLFAKTKIYLTV